jgi:hypothetical protein
MQHNGMPVYAQYIEHLPPDPGACKLWLTNRRKKDWTDTSKLEHTGKDGEPLVPETRSDRDIARAIVDIFRAAHNEQGSAEPDEPDEPEDGVPAVGDDPPRRMKFNATTWAAADWRFDIGKKSLLIGLSESRRRWPSGCQRRRCNTSPECLLCTSSQCEARCKIVDRDHNGNAA